MKHLLITGFDPFAGATSNPAWEAVSRLPDTIGIWRLTKLRIPTVFGAAARTVIAAEKADPADLILCVGLASTRDAVTPERIAVNIRDARGKGTRDNAGHLAQGERCAPDGPAAYFSTAPAEEMAAAIRNVDISSAVSNTAGTFVCNDTMYLLLHEYTGTGTKVGFIHVPPLPRESGDSDPCMQLADIIKALSAAIAVIQ